MFNVKIYGRCETCQKKGFFIRRREVRLPIGRLATSQRMMCRSCKKRVEGMLGTNNITEV